MFNSGWANSCGVELFTRWVTCEQAIETPEPEIRPTWGGSIPAKEPFLDKQQQIAIDDNDIISLIVASIESGIIQ